MTYKHGIYLSAARMKFDAMSPLNSVSASGRKARISLVRLFTFVSLISAKHNSIALLQNNKCHYQDISELIYHQRSYSLPWNSKNTVTSRTIICTNPTILYHTAANCIYEHVFFICPKFVSFSSPNDMI